MAEIIPMTEEQKFKLEIYRLLSKNNSRQRKLLHSLVLTN